MASVGTGVWTIRCFFFFKLQQGSPGQFPASFLLATLYCPKFQELRLSKDQGKDSHFLQMLVMRNGTVFLEGEFQHLNFEGTGRELQREFTIAISLCQNAEL